MDATFTLTSTSFRPNAGILTSRISAPGAASGLTTASMVLGMIGIENESKVDSSTGSGSGFLANFAELSARFAVKELISPGSDNRGPCRHSLAVHLFPAPPTSARRFDSNSLCLGRANIELARQ